MHNRSELRLFARGFLTVLSGSLLGKVLMFCLTLLLARLLTVGDVGLYFICFSAVTVLSVISTTGMRIGVVRFISIYNGKFDTASMRGTVIIGLIFTFCISTIIVVLLTIYEDLIVYTVYNNADLKQIFGIFVACIPIEAARLIFCAATDGLKKMHYSIFVEHFVINCCRLIFFVYFLWINNYGIVGAAYSFIIASSVGLFISAFFCIFEMFFRLKGFKIRFPTLEVVLFSLPMMPASFIFNSAKQMDVLMLGWLWTSEGVGIYSIALRLCLLGEVVFRSFQQILQPFIADYYSKNQMNRLMSLYHFSVKWCFLLSVPIFILFAAYPSFFLDCFNKSMVVGGVALTVLGLGHLLSSLSNLSGAIVSMTGYSRLSLINNTIFIIINIAGNYIFIPICGMLGAAYSHVISILVLSMLRYYQVWKILKMPPLKVYVLKIAFSGCMSICSVLIFCGYDHLQTITKGILLILLFIFVYVLFLSIFVLTADDKRMFLKFKTKFMRKFFARA